MQKHYHINLSAKIIEISAHIKLKINNDKIPLITRFAIDDIICKNTLLTQLQKS